MDALPPELLLSMYPSRIRDAADRLRAIVRRAIPGAIEGVRPGWRVLGYRMPVGPRRAPYFGFVMPEVVHVHLGFEYGALMDDPERILGGRELKRVRFLTFRGPDEIDDEDRLEALVVEAARIATFSRGERLARLLDPSRDASTSPRGD